MLALFKHAKNFVSKSEERPLFNGIYFDGQRAVISNTSLMVVVNDLPFKKQIIHWKTGEEIKGNYPDIDKVIPQETEFNSEFEDIDGFIKALKVAMYLSDKSDYGPICSLEGLFLGAKSKNMIFTANLTGAIMDKPNPEVFFNGKYLYDILNFFKDAGVSKVTIGINGPLAPMKLTTDKNILAVLTPVMTGDKQ